MVCRVKIVAWHTQAIVWAIITIFPPFDDAVSVSTFGSYGVVNNGLLVILAALNQLQTFTPKKPVPVVRPHVLGKAMVHQLMCIGSQNAARLFGSQSQNI